MDWRPRVARLLELLHLDPRPLRSDTPEPMGSLAQYQWGSLRSRVLVSIPPPLLRESSGNPRTFVFLGIMLGRACSRNFFPKLGHTYPNPSVWWRPRARAETPWRVVAAVMRAMCATGNDAETGRGRRGALSPDGRPAWTLEFYEEPVGSRCWTSCAG